jgi:hypothetical protein
MIEKALQVSCNAFCDSIFRLIEMLTENDSISAYSFEDTILGSNSITRRLGKIAFTRDSN